MSVPDPITVHLGRWCSSTQRPRALLRLLAAQAPDDGQRFWRLVAAQWSGFDAIPHRAYATAFRRHRPTWSPEVMAQGDRTFYEALPANLTIYRGQDASAPLGLAWTLDREVALSFARGHRGMCNALPLLLTVTVKKEDVALAFSDRGESEIVLFVPPKAKKCTMTQLFSKRSSE